MRANKQQQCTRRTTYDMRWKWGKTAEKRKIGRRRIWQWHIPLVGLSVGRCGMCNRARQTNSERTNLIGILSAQLRVCVCCKQAKHRTLYGVHKQHNVPWDWNVLGLYTTTHRHISQHHHTQHTECTVAGSADRYRYFSGGSSSRARGVRCD